ncbi:type VII secretion integral membrane protein EccD [Corynebacterium mayonis]|uniref:type VII secretion integral membrane protein EccD n=1 Tax=Corynebacterium mayonis TaxID=3062461 RepID=UPI0031401144
MVAATAHHIVHVTIRIDVVTFHRDIDLTLPTSSSLAEILPELSRLVDLPAVRRPWQATTAAGAPLDMNTPLYQLKLYDGSVIALRPQENPRPPVVRDAAEALAADAENANQVRGLDVAASCTGAVAFGILVSPWLGVAGALAAAGLLAVLLSLPSRGCVLHTCGSVSAAAGCAVWVAGPPSTWVSSQDPALGAAAGAGVLLLATGVGAALTSIGAAVAAACLSTAVLVCVAAVGAWLPSAYAPAAVAVLAVLIVLTVAPRVATRAAGLRIPHIPTAGEEFASADTYQSDVDKRARRAREITAGIHFGCALVACPALVALAWPGTGWAQALCVGVVGAFALHAGRHHYPAPRLAVSAITLSAVVSCAVAASRADFHPVPMLATAAVVALLSATAVVWVSRVPEIEPTTTVWLERIESACLILALPIALHLAGVFDAIRGL